MKAIQVNQVSKKFSQSLKYLMRYVPLDVGRSMLGLKRDTARLRRGEFWAVDDVSFELAPGERMGLIGRNGSGKSTLLKLLNGILLPDRGTIHIRGRVGALIEVGAGFHPLLTGRENIYINGAILGIKQAEIRRKFDEIVAFADIGDFLDSPVKFYSSGMYVRLGFAVAVHAEPDILLIDEVLAVGDFSFQKKCFDRLDTIAERGATIILVSHSMAAVQRLCPQALLLERGKVLFHGPSSEATAKYYESLLPTYEKETDPRIVHRFPGSMAVLLTGLDLLDAEARPVQRVTSGDPLRFVLRLRVQAQTLKQLPRVAIRLMDAQTEELLANIQTPQQIVQEARPERDLTLVCDLPSLNLAPGIYQVEIKIGGDGEDLHEIALLKQPLEVNWSGYVVDNMSYKGRIFLPGEWRIGNGST